MLKLIFTLDYEIHGNGDGNPYNLMIEPTDRLMDLFDQYNAKLVIFADVAEIIKFKEYRDQFGKDDYCYEQIIYQLRNAVLRGHDVQLHIHSSYFDSYVNKEKWIQNWNKYNLADLSFDDINHIIKTSKQFLEEEIIKPIKPNYKCYVFRAPNWSMHPTKKISTALLDNGIYIDSSVYKYGKQKGWVNYDYTTANNEMFPYKASMKDICKFDPNSKLIEFPIHCELKPLTSFISLIRIFRALRALNHKHANNNHRNSGQIKIKTKRNDFLNSCFRVLFTKHPRKFDFNQLTAHQMINTLKKVDINSQEFNYITLIGHSKSFIKYNERTLKCFLMFIHKNRDKYSFSLYNRNEP